MFEFVTVPGPSRLIPDKTPPISPTESELDIERGLDFGPGEKDDDHGLEPPQEEEEEDPYGVNLIGSLGETRHECKQRLMSLRNEREPARVPLDTIPRPPPLVASPPFILFSSFLHSLSQILLN